MRALIAVVIVEKCKGIKLATMSYMMATICGVNEVTKMMSWIIDSSFGGKVLNPLALPLHLCSLLLFVVISIYSNSILSVYGTNFFFIVRPPLERLPVLNLDNGWFVYSLRVIGIAVSVVTLFHLLFIIKERKIVTSAQITID